MHAAGAEQIGDAVGEHPGLARAGAGDDEQRRAGVHDGGALLLVQPLQQRGRVDDGARRAVAVVRVPAARPVVACPRRGRAGSRLRGPRRAGRGAPRACGGGPSCALHGLRGPPGSCRRRGCSSSTSLGCRADTAPQHGRCRVGRDVGRPGVSSPLITNRYRTYHHRPSQQPHNFATVPCQAARTTPSAKASARAASAESDPAVPPEPGTHRARATACATGVNRDLRAASACARPVGQPSVRPNPSANPVGGPRKELPALASHRKPRTRILQVRHHDAARSASPPPPSPPSPCSPRARRPRRTTASRRSRRSRRRSTSCTSRRRPPPRSTTPPRRRRTSSARRSTDPRRRGRAHREAQRRPPHARQLRRRAVPQRRHVPDRHAPAHGGPAAVLPADAR